MSQFKRTFRQDILVSLNSSVMFVIRPSPTCINLVQSWILQEENSSRLHFEHEFILPMHIKLVFFSSTGFVIRSRDYFFNLLFDDNKMKALNQMMIELLFRVIDINVGCPPWGGISSPCLSVSRVSHLTRFKSMREYKIISPDEFERFWFELWKIFNFSYKLILC